jgi:hypothetical protein
VQNELGGFALLACYEAHHVQARHQMAAAELMRKAFVSVAGAFGDYSGVGLPERTEATLLARLDNMP